MNLKSAFTQLAFVQLWDFLKIINWLDLIIYPILLQLIFPPGKFSIFFAKSNQDFLDKTDSS